MTVPSARARAAGAVLTGAMRAIRTCRNRRLGLTDDASPDAVAEVFEDGAVETRALLDRTTALMRPVVGVDEEEVSGAPVRTWRFAPHSPPLGRTVLYLHGGAYVAGSHATHRVLASAVARVSGAVAVLPEYRLAPEHRFPAPVEDALATYRWLLDEGVEPGRLVIAGDSVGGDRRSRWRSPCATRACHRQPGWRACRRGST